jgi:hypothetical protein
LTPGLSDKRFLSFPAWSSTRDSFLGEFAVAVQFKSGWRHIGNFESA